MANYSNAHNGAHQPSEVGGFSFSAWLGVAALSRILPPLMLAFLMLINWCHADSLRLHGSNTVGEKYAPLLIEGFLKHQGYVLISIKPGAVAVEKQIVATDSNTQQQFIVDLKSHGSSTGFADLLAKKTDIAMSSRPIKAAELEALQALYPNLERAAMEHIIAFDALAVIVHPDNPINHLTLAQLAQVFAGEIDNWQALGGADQPLSILARDDNSGTYDTFKSLVLKPNERKLTPQAKRFESSSQLTQQVLTTPGAIGFVGISHTAESKILAIATAPGASGIKPDQYTIGTEDYPLSRRLYLYAPTLTQGSAAKAFIEFAVSETGQRLAKNAELISFFPTSSRPRLDQRNLQREYRNLALYGRRLSVTLRLDNNQLDGKTRRDLARIVSYHQQNPHNRIVLAGFWDDPKLSPSSQQQLATWLEVLKQALNEAALEPWLVSGGFLPIENNQVEQGRALNRRVEVWVL
ncbi:MAG: substrate-binding domain-containing protein [Gammaproteobacteria bacterium]|nr:substrate-binding domain-containing protein [Gammaproteobacteria bacterium]